MRTVKRSFKWRLIEFKVQSEDILTRNQVGRAARVTAPPISGGLVTQHAQ